MVIHSTSADRKPKKGDKRLRPVKPSKRVELWYLSQLNSIARALRAFGNELVRELRTSWPTVRDALPPTARELLKKGRHKFQVQVPGAGAEIAAKLTRKSLDDVDVQLAQSVNASIGVDIRAALVSETPMQAAMRASARENVELISSIPTQYFDQLEELVTDAWDAGMEHSALADIVENLAGVTESRAALIARDQTSKLNSSFNRIRQTSIGIKRFQWQTAEDDDVRDSHYDLDGEVFDWDDLPIVDGETAAPGEPINCRCVASPVMDDDEENDVEDISEAADDAEEEAA